MRSQNGPQEMKIIEAAPKQPGTAGPGNMLGYCLVSFHFLWAILWPHTVELPASPFRVIFWRDTLFPPGYFCASSFYGAVILFGRKEGRKESHKKDPKSVLVATALHPEIGNSTFISSDKKREGEVQCGASRHSWCFIKSIFEMFHRLLGCCRNCAAQLVTGTSESKQNKHHEWGDALRCRVVVVWAHFCPFPFPALPVRVLVRRSFARSLPWESCPSLSLFHQLCDGPSGRQAGRPTARRCPGERTAESTEGRRQKRRKEGGKGDMEGMLSRCSTQCTQWKRQQDQKFIKPFHCHNLTALNPRVGVFFAFFVPLLFVVLLTVAGIALDL